METEDIIIAIFAGLFGMLTIVAIIAIGATTYQSFYPEKYQIKTNNINLEQKGN